MTPISGLSNTTVVETPAGASGPEADRTAFVNYVVPGAFRCGHRGRMGSRATGGSTQSRRSETVSQIGVDEDLTWRGQHRSSSDHETGPIAVASVVRPKWMTCHGNRNHARMRARYEQASLLRCPDEHLIMPHQLDALH